MDNAQGYAEAYKDVIHEDAIRVSGGTEATDRQIDQLVYELYGLSDDEIRIVVDAGR